MPQVIMKLLPYILPAVAVGIAGGVIAAFWRPKGAVRSGIQHFAAGLVIAAIAAEVLPEIEQYHQVPQALIGFAVGGCAMVAMRWGVHKFAQREQSKQSAPIGLAVAAALDTGIDGSIIGAAFASGQHLGLVLVLALGVELFFLMLSVGTAFHDSSTSRWQKITVTSGIALMLALGAFGSSLFLADASQAVLTVVLSFGSAALIYLVAEELLVEAHQAAENLLSTALLFGGFWAFFAFDLFTSGG